MKSFRHNSRVYVRIDADGHPVEAEGAVVRFRRADNGAWIRLDERKAGVYFPFPAGEDRECHILAYPEDCRAAHLKTVL